MVISQVLLVSLTRSALLGWDPDKSAAVSFRTQSHKSKPVFFSRRRPPIYTNQTDEKTYGISRKVCYFFFLKMPFSSPSLMGDLQPSKKVKGLGGRTSQCRYLISRASFPRKEISAVYEHRNGGDRKKVKCHLFPTPKKTGKKI